MSFIATVLRPLRRAPGFTGAVVATLAVGIGATVAVFTVVQGVVLSPLPYRQPERLAGVWLALPGMGRSFASVPQSLSSYFTYRKMARTIDGIAVFDRTSVNLTDTRNHTTPRRVRAALVTASLLPLLGVPAERGRVFGDADDLPTSRPVVIISDRLWRRQFAADPSIIGRQIEIDGTGTTVIGIAPPSLHFPDDVTDAWAPIGLDPAAPFGGPFAHQAVVRIRPGVSMQAVQRELTALIPRISELYQNVMPGTTTTAFLTSAHASAVVRPLRQDIVANFGSVVWIAGVAGILLLLIAVANVAGLLIARSEGRQRELAVRIALGAGGWRLLRQFLGESLLLASLGTLGGVAIAYAGIGALVRLGPQGIPRLGEVHVGVVPLLFAGAIAVGITIVCGGLALSRCDTRHLTNHLRDGARGGTTGRDRQRARRTLVVTQVAFATLLVGGACLLLRSFDRLRQVKPGFDVDHTLTLWLSLPQSSYADDSAVVRATRRLLDAVHGVPGVSAVGAASKIPLNRLGSIYTTVWSDADRANGGSLPPSQQIVAATGDYFSSMRIPLIAGRTFAASGQTPYEAIIDQSLAFQFWRDSTGRTGLGRKIRITQGLWYTVVGVVGAVHDTSLAAPPNGVVYLPDVPAPDPNNSMVTRTIAITIHTLGDPHSLVRAIERAVAGVDPSLPAFAVASMNDLAGQSLGRLSFVMTLLGISAGIALVLAMIGLYGVLAYMVSLRRREIGVRLALGAVPSSVARLVARQGVGLSAVGVALGFAGFGLMVRFLGNLVFGVAGSDPITLASVASVLIAVAAAASWIPARNAAAVDPALSLGSE